jgi:uncharacterized protein YtpQ (UPF0354 family)
MSLSTVLPLLRGFREIEGFVGGGSRLLEGDDVPVTRDFVEDIRIVYAFDEGSHYRWAHRGDLGLLKVTEDELDERAYTNLVERCRRLNLSVDPTPTGLTHLVRIGEDLEASLLMHAGLWNDLASQMPGKLVATCPAKEVLAIGCLAVPGSLEELVAGARRVLKEVRSPVSALVLEWESDGWNPRFEA